VRAPCVRGVRELTPRRWNRGWRWHKEQRLWLTKEGMPAAHAKTAGGEAGAFVVWDADAWAKDVRELSVLYADLEEKLAPVFPQTAALAYPGQQAPPAVQVQGRPFQGAGIAAM
jgi:CCR4-NOT transcription complex subunit 2